MLLGTLPLLFTLLGDTAELYFSPTMALISQSIPKMRPRFAGGACSFRIASVHTAGIKQKGSECGVGLPVLPFGLLVKGVGLYCERPV